MSTVQESRFATVTYSPYTRKFYKGSIEAADFNQTQNQHDIARLNPDKKLGDGRLEFIDTEMVRRAERHQRDGVINSNEISNITNVDMLQEVIGSLWKNTYLREMCTIISVPKLQLKVPYRNAKMAARAKVPELNVPNETNTEFSQASFNLWKNVVDIYASDEARYRGTIEPLNYDIGQASGALGQLANTQIATELHDATDASKGSWSAVTSAVNDRKPFDDITAEWIVIDNLHYNPTHIAMHPQVWSDYISNTWVTGAHIGAPSRSPAGTFQLPIVNGLTAVVDSAITDGSAILLDKSTFLLGEGPMVAEQYRDPHRAADGYVIRHYLEPLLVTTDGSRELTSL